MRSTLMTTAAMLGLLAASPSFAQTGSTQSPPSPGASSGMPQPTNSLPPGSATSQSAPGGSNLNGSTSQVPTGPSGRPMAPAPMARPAAVAPPTTMAPTTVAPTTVTPTTVAPPPVATIKPRPPMPAHRMGMRPRPAPASTATPMADDTGAPPTAAYRGGAGSPLSTTATNLRPGREMGARLPEPETGGGSPRDYLMAAQTALNRGQTGKAQEALERAETRILSRTTDPSRADVPDQAAMARNIAEARRMLGARDVRGAKAAIAAAMNDRVPGPGPAVSVTPAMPAMPGM